MVLDMISTLHCEPWLHGPGREGRPMTPNPCCNCRAAVVAPSRPRLSPRSSVIGHTPVRAGNTYIRAISEGLPELPPLADRSDSKGATGRRMSDPGLPQPAGMRCGSVDHR